MQQALARAQEARSSGDARGYGGASFTAVVAATSATETFCLKYWRTSSRRNGSGTKPRAGFDAHMRLCRWGRGRGLTLKG